MTNPFLYYIANDVANSKTSPTDPLPAKLLSNCIDTLLPLFVDLINKSLREGTVEGLKHSVITPIHKKHNLDVNLLKSYRPIFNIPFVCKLTEKFILKQFIEHISGTTYDCPNQHGYKKHHSTETMLLDIYDEAMLGFDNDYCTVMVMIDMSAAFDTVDIDKLLNILSLNLNIGGVAYSWFESFLLGRSQCVKIENNYSNFIDSKFGFIFSMGTSFRFCFKNLFLDLSMYCKITVISCFYRTLRFVSQKIVCLVSETFDFTMILLHFIHIA